VRRLRLSVASRARIFLSSGQAEGKAEIARILAAKRNLERLGFQVTVATGTSVTRGVWEAILQRLHESEYFLLVDYKREPQTADDWDRSVVSHQELAIAISLGIPYRVLVEKGLRKRVGILSLVPSSPIIFERRNLVRQVRATVAKARWDPRWRSEIELDRRIRRTHNKTWVSYDPHRQNLHAKYFLVSAHNRSQTTIATEVHAFAEGWSGGPQRLPFMPAPLLELKWDAVTPRAVSIPPGKERRFTGVFVLKERPGYARMGANEILMDSNSFERDLWLGPPGRFLLHLVVFSREFRPARTTFELRLESNADRTTLMPVPSPTPGPRRVGL
jgi:hypothetical protein